MKQVALISQLVSKMPSWHFFDTVCYANLTFSLRIWSRIHALPRSGLFLRPLLVFFLACGSIPTAAKSFPNTRSVDLAVAGVQHPEQPIEPGKVGLRRKIVTGANITKHFVKSHSSSLLLRPVSSVRNLVSLTVSAATGLIKDTALDTLLFPWLDDSRIPPLATTDGMDLDEWENHLDKMTGTQRTRGSLDLLIDGEAFFDRLTEEIAASRESIKFRTYIFDNDDYALRIADMLKERSKEIPVDIFVDGLGTLGGGLITSTSMPKDFVTPVSIESYISKNSNVNLRLLGNTWLMGDHTKTFIFDDKVAFLGGMNIGREYRYDWHDLMVELSGPIVDQLTHDTNKTLARSKFGDLAFLQPVERKHTETSAGTGSELRLLYTKPLDAQIYRAQLEAIRRSRSYVYIQNAYLADDLVLYQLVKARLRGVDVRVIVPSRPDSGLMDRSNVLAINVLERYGVRVYVYPGMTHVKAAIYDGWACIGTANFDKLSFKINKEVNIGTSDPRIVAELKQKVFEVDFAVSQEVTTRRPVYVVDHIYEKIVDVVL